MLRQKDLKLIAANKNKNEAKFKFEGLSTRSQRWFHIYFDCIEVNFSTCEPGFYPIHKIQIRLKAFKFQ